MDIKIADAVTLITDKVETWLEQLIALLPNLVIAIVVTVLFVLLAKTIRNVAGKLFSRISQNRAVNNLLVTVIYATVLTIGFFISLTIVELDGVVTSLLAGVGIVGLALGFAFQDIAANFISGVLIAVGQPFRVGDIIKSGDNFGTVTNINLRTTTVRTFQGIEVLIPNKDLFQEVVENYTNTRDRRVDLSVGVSYGDDLDKVKELTIGAIQQLSSIDTRREVSLFYTEFGDSSINFSVRFWAKTSGQADYLQAQSDGIMAIKKLYDENDITIPFPIRTLDFGIKGGEKLSEMTLQHSNGVRSN
ncbi:MAG: mechanosensitive ion channel family protein [Tunicatimonas sp.]